MSIINCEIFRIVNEAYKTGAKKKNWIQLRRHNLLTQMAKNNAIQAVETFGFIGTELGRIEPPRFFPLWARCSLPQLRPAPRSCRSVQSLALVRCRRTRDPVHFSSIHTPSGKSSLITSFKGCLRFSCVGVSFLPLISRQKLYRIRWAHSSGYDNLIMQKERYTSKPRAE